MTSNLGSEYLLKDTEKGKNDVMDLVKKTFKPEFLNRIDEIILFNPLGFNVQVKIVDKLLTELQTRLFDQDIKVSYSDALKKYILNNGYSLEYGARPIKRFIQKFVETGVAYQIVLGKIVPHESYILNVENDTLIVEKSMS